MVKVRVEDIKVRRVNTEEEFLLLKERWNTLLRESAENNYFLSWEWLWTWWEAYKVTGLDLCILLFERGEHLIGIAPFYMKQIGRKKAFGSRRLLFLGTQEGKVISEYMDVIHRRGEEADVLRQMLGFINDRDLCDEILLHKMKTDSLTIQILKDIAKEKRLQFAMGESIKCPFIELPSSYEVFLTSMTPSLRWKLRSGPTRLGRYADVNFRKTNGVFELESDFKELVRLHQLRWKLRNHQGSFSDREFHHFQQQVMKEMLKNGHLELWFLSIDGINIAAIYNIRYHDKIYYYQSGLDVLFDRRLSPGLLLHGHCIREAIHNQVQEYDFLLQGELDSYKQRWTQEYRTVADIHLARTDKVNFLTKIGNLLKTS